MPQPTPPHSMSDAGNSGAGVGIGERLGARMGAGEHGTNGLWTPASVTIRRDGSRGLYPHLLLDRAKPGLLAVNSAGRRFVNEAVSYHDFVEAMFESHKLAPSIPAYLICDGTFIGRYGPRAIPPGPHNLKRFERNGYLITGRSLDDLAQKIGVPPQAFRDTAARPNRFADSGVDLDFGKADAAPTRLHGVPDHKPAPFLGTRAPPPSPPVSV